MFRSLLQKVIGDPNAREIKRLQPLVDQINALEPEMERLPDDAFAEMTGQFRRQIREETASLREDVEAARQEMESAQGAEAYEQARRAFKEADQALRRAEGVILDRLLPRAFAAVRETARHTIRLRHFDVQLIGGIILTLDRSFAMGDKVSVDGEIGVVLEVGLRNTLIQTYDNEVIVIPNGELMSKKFKNFALPNPEVRVVVDFSVVYGSDPDSVERVVLDALKSVSEIKENPAPEVLFDSMGDFALNFQARFWIPMFGNQFMKKVEATKKIYNALNAAGIGIPFPTHTVYLQQKA